MRGGATSSLLCSLLGLMARFGARARAAGPARLVSYELLLANVSWATRVAAQGGEAPPPPPKVARNQALERACWVWRVRASSCAPAVPSPPTSTPRADLIPPGRISSLEGLTTCV